MPEDPAAVRPDEVGAALGAVADVLDRLGGRYYVGGSLASSVRGAPRASIDVDVAAELEPGHLAAFVQALAERGPVPVVYWITRFLMFWPPPPFESFHSRNLPILLSAKPTAR